MSNVTSPRITAISWGRTEVDGLGHFKDVKLWPGGGRAWDWNETGTSHAPGIQPADVEELVEHGSEVIVLSRGMAGSLRVCPETVEMAEAHGIEVRIEQTLGAVSTYNRLARTRRVGALIHSSC